jgi:hypothetical protein
MVLFVVYSVYNSEAQKRFSATSACSSFLLVLSALAGQLADCATSPDHPRGQILRILIARSAGLVLAWKDVAVHAVAIPLMLLALFAMGVHSSFGPIKYAILPQHLKTKVLAGTGWARRNLHRDPGWHHPGRLD